MSVRIDRCHCFDVPFADLADVAEEAGAETVKALQQHVRFGEKCQLCHPYVRRMLRSGQTVFGEIIAASDELTTAESAAK